MPGDLFGGGGESTVVNTAGPMSAEEKELIGLQVELSKRQLSQLDQLQPFQKQLIELSMADLQRTGKLNEAFDTAITPEQQALAAKDDFERAQRLGPIQDELLQLQLENVRSGGAATPEQLARIKAATDAGISAGSADIDLSTKRGIGMIADELANSRGLRLSDSPITAEAALLARGGEDQKANLIKTMRAAEATSALNFPLAASQITSGINLSTQNLTDATRQFQADLRQRAFQNRLALTGQTAQTGIGLASIGGNATGAISALENSRGSTRTTTGGGGMDLGGLGSLLQGGAAIGKWLSDRRLKSNIVKVGDDPRGFGIYRYVIFGMRQIGVMADEVAKVIPGAVSRGRDGFLRVDYGMLGYDATV